VDDFIEVGLPQGPSAGPLPGFAYTTPALQALFQKQDKSFGDDDIAEIVVVKSHRTSPATAAPRVVPAVTVAALRRYLLSPFSRTSHRAASSTLGSSSQTSLSSSTSTQSVFSAYSSDALSPYVESSPKPRGSEYALASFFRRIRAPWRRTRI
jgi:hypothetical protein